MLLLILQRKNSSNDCVYDSHDNCLHSKQKDSNIICIAEVRCSMPEPNNTNHGSDTVDGEYLDSETMTCVNGYVLVGSAGTPTDVTYHIICEASGVWSANTACQRE